MTTNYNHERARAVARVLKLYDTPRPSISDEPYEMDEDAYVELLCDIMHAIQAQGLNAETLVEEAQITFEDDNRCHF